MGERDRTASFREKGYRLQVSCPRVKMLINAIQGGLMRKITLLTLLFTFIISSSVQALSWAIPFVVWKGKVYEIKQEKIISESEIGKKLGEVKTVPDDMTGEYYGDASNFYPIGTKYYEIIGTSPSKAIAVKEESQLVKAVYVHKAPFHILNVLSNPIFLILGGIIVLIIIRAIIRAKKLNK
jgi:hypothetical protein